MKGNRKVVAESGVEAVVGFGVSGSAVFESGGAEEERVVSCGTERFAVLAFLDAGFEVEVVVLFPMFGGGVAELFGGIG